LPQSSSKLDYNINIFTYFLGDFFMSMKKLALVVALTTTALTASADDSKNFFGKLNLGYSFGTNPGSNIKSTGKSYLAGVEFGGRVNEVIRLGVEFDALPKFSGKVTGLASGYSVENVKITTYRGFFNVYADLGNFNGVQPYVTAGIGMAKNKTKDANVTGPNGANFGTIKGSSKTNAAFKGGLGVAYSINEDIDVSLHYQYVDMGKFQSKNPDGTTACAKLKANEAVIGIAYKF